MDHHHCTNFSQLRRYVHIRHQLSRRSVISLCPLLATVSSLHCATSRIVPGPTKSMIFSTSLPLTERFHTDDCCAIWKERLIFSHSKVATRQMNAHLTLVPRTGLPCTNYLFLAWTRYSLTSDCR